MDEFFIQYEMDHIIVDPNLSLIGRSLREVIFYDDFQEYEVARIKTMSKGKDTLGTPVIISCWKLSKEDFEEIQRTGCVYLTICSTGMPPVTLQTESPFVQN